MTHDIDKNKITTVAMWFLSRHGYMLPRRILLILCYLSDKKHMEKYLRTVVGGNYVRKGMNIFNEQIESDSSFKYAFKKINDDRIKAQDIYFDEQQLSESDCEIMEEINRTYGNQDIYKLFSNLPKNLDYCADLCEEAKELLADQDASELAFIRPSSSDNQ